MRILVFVLGLLAAPPLGSAATFTVTTSLDLVDTSIGDGFCRSSEGQMCSLRAAIQESNASAGPDLVVLQNAGPYELELQELDANDPDDNGATTGDLDVADVVTIMVSAGQPRRRIQVAFNELQGDPPEDRIFHVLPGGDLTLSGVSLEDGVATSVSTSRGGAILNEGTLVLSDCTIDGNDALEGGGIYNDGELEVDACTFTNNDARDDGGGPGEGGVLFSSSVATTTVTRSTFTNNGAEVRGGVIFGEDGTVLDLENSTLSLNVGPDVLWLENVLEATLTHLTLDTNFGTGIVANLAQPLALEVVSSIVSDSGAANCAFSAAPTTLTSLSSDLSCGFAAGGGFDNADPLLGPLGANGGSTLTRLPDVASLAVDNAALARCPLEDQRGTLRPDGDGGAGDCDIGSVELLPEPGASLLALAALGAVGALARGRS